MTWWPPRSRRSVIRDPRRPGRIGLNCFSPPGDRRERRVDGLADLVKALGHIPQLDPQHPPAMIPQRLKITERLRLLQDTEREPLTRNLEILRVVPHQLEDNAVVRAALVKLAGRMQIARSVAGAGGDPILVANRQLACIPR